MQSTICDLYVTNLKVKSLDLHQLSIHKPTLLPGSLQPFVLYGCLITFVICASWTGDIYYPHIKLPSCPYVRTSSIATQLMSFPLFRHNLHKISFPLRSVAEVM